MKDEIKEILECIKDKKRDYVGTNGCLYQDLDRKELNLLLDYITNLQEKYERMKENAEILSNGYNKLEKRNEKAIEYVKRVCESEKNINPYILHAPTLLNILNGGDEE